MTDVRPIPSPPAVRWREFRVRALPPIMFVVLVAVGALLWQRHAVPARIVGEVESIRADLKTTVAGTVVGLRVNSFQSVRSGDPLAQVLTTTPQILESTLAVIRAEVDLLLAQTDPLVTRERAQLDYERLRTEWLDQRVQLATGRMRLQFAEAEFERMTRLFETEPPIASRVEYETALRDRNALRDEVAAREQLLDQVAQRLEQFVLASPDRGEDAEARALRAAIRVQEQRLRLAEAELSPVTLASPLGGVVSAVYRQPGENVVAGDSILTVTSAKSDRIIAYLVPPWTEEPTVGTPVEVRARTTRRTAAIATVTHVGTYMEPVRETLMGSLLGRRVVLDGRAPGLAATEIGLPIVVTLPPELHLRPGELVDMRLLPGPARRHPGATPTSEAPAAQ